jgi:hypothetical protein
MQRNKTNLLILFFTLQVTLFSPSLLAQENKTDPKPKVLLPEQPCKVIALNTTPLLIQFVPFNRSDPRLSGPFYVEWRNYGAYKDGRHNGLRIGLGGQFQITEDLENDRSFLAFRVAFEGRRSINQRWGYYRGFTVAFSAGNLNTVPSSGQSTFLGMGPHWGLEYVIAQRVSLSVETALLIGTGDFGPRLEFIPPVGLFCNFWLPRRKAVDPQPN